MKLSERGCIPKLVDFLRVNEDDDLMEITGVIAIPTQLTSRKNYVWECEV